MAIDKIFKSSNVDDLADNILSEVDDFMVSVDKMQQRKVAGNVQKVIQAFKQIETDLQDRYDNVTDVLEKRVSTIKDGRDGLNGTDGRSGRDGKPGRDGVNGKQGPPGTPGKDGADGLDGVSVTNANIDFDGSLVISLSSGQQINVGEVVPPELERQLVELRQGGGSAGSSGDVMGPTASTDNAIVRFDGTTGKVVQNSEVTIDDTGNTNFAQTPVLYSGDGTVESGRLLGRYSYRTATPTTAYFYDFNNSNTITSADSLFATKLATLIDSTVTNDNALTAFGTSYGTKAAGVSFVSGTASDVLLASVGSAPLLNADINAVVVGYTSVGPRIAIQNYALNDDTANAISYVGAVHRFYPAGTEVAKISSTGLDVTGAATVSTTLGVTGVSTLTAGAVIQGLTVGRGAGAISSNTAVGASALAANSTGTQSVAVGGNALAANLTSNCTAVGHDAAKSNTSGILITAVGQNCLAANTTGNNNVGLGRSTLQSNISGGQNTVVGTEAGKNNISGSNLIALGYRAGQGVTGSNHLAIGQESLNAASTGQYNVAVASYRALLSNTSGSNNVAVGDQTLQANQTSGNSTAVGYQAGLVSTGIGNQFFGYSSGSAVTTGATNVILGSYTGSAAPISATGSNFVVLSDGDGNVRQFFNGANATFNGTVSVTGTVSATGAVTATGSDTGDVFLGLNSSASNRNDFVVRNAASNMVLGAVVGTTGILAGNSVIATVSSTGLAVTGNVLATSTGGLGYGTGSGGAVTQATSRTTGVTLNKTNGAITLVSAAGLATFQSFTVTNSTVAATDVVHVTQKSGTDLYQIFVTATAAGSFRISYATTGGITTEQPVFNFAVIKAVTA